MLTAFYAALSGLNANALYLSIIGNNLANLNTIGFKTNLTTFGDLLSQSLGAAVNGAGNPMQIGLGTQLLSTTPLFTQGSLMTTGSATNMAILGGGFFILKDPNNASSYTRAGNFTLDKDGFLVSPDGSFVQGWSTKDAAGKIIANTALGSIKINTGDLNPPKATTVMTHVTNLDASATAGATSAYSTSVVIYDSLGTAHTVTYNFQKTAANTWTVSLSVPAADGTVTTTPASPITLTFDPATGKLLTPAAGANPTATFTWTTGAAAQTATWDIWDTNVPPSASITQYGSPSSTSSTTQDGWGAGTISAIAVQTDGVIQAVYSNGQTAELAQVALANFNNPTGLLRMGQNLWSETVTSGSPSTGEPSTGGRGSIAGGNLELSNVDIAQEFTNIITAQRGYQANSRVITTADELMQDAIALKR